MKYPRLTFLEDFFSDVPNEPTKKMVKASRKSNRNISAICQWLSDSEVNWRIVKCIKGQDF